MEGGAVVLTLKDQNILADGDINLGETLKLLLYFPANRCPLTAWQFYVREHFFPDVTEIDMLENVEIGEQKRRDEAYKAAKKKVGIYVDK